MHFDRLRGTMTGVVLLGIESAAGCVCAQADPLTIPESRRETAVEIERRTAAAMAQEAAIEGPATIELLDQAELTLTAGFAYVPARQAARLMRAHAHRTENQNDRYPNLVGLVVATDASQEGGLVLIRFVGEGHIEDGRAANWDADGLLARIRAKVAAAKPQDGTSKPKVLGWAETPAYDTVRRHLVSALLTQWGASAADSTPRLDFDAYALGRDGYVHLKLLTTPSLLASQRPMIDGLLNTLRYRPGKRYEDFDALTDRTAPQGPEALVGGGLLREPGRSDLLFAYLETFGRPAVALIVLGVWLVRWSRRRMETGQPTA